MQQKVYEPLRKKGDFKKTFDLGLKFPSKYLITYARPNGLSSPRLGLSVSRKIGNAVIRNRVKRRLREVVRKELLGRSLGYDLVIVARSASVNAAFADLANVVCRLLSGLAHEDISGNNHTTV